MGVDRKKLAKLKSLKRDKLRLDLVPPEMDEALAKVLMGGAKKYGERQWELEPWSEEDILAAAMRHLLQHRKGELIDRESGLPHLWHSFCSLGMALTYREREASKRVENKHFS